MIVILTDTIVDYVGTMCDCQCHIDLCFYNKVVFYRVGYVRNSSFYPYSARICHGK